MPITLALTTWLALAATPADANRRRAGAVRWANAASAALRDPVRIYEQPGRRRLGKMAGGQRVPITAVAGPRAGCPRWLQIDGRGWICATHARPSDQAPQLIRHMDIDPLAPTAARAAQVIQDAWALLPGVGRVRVRASTAVVVHQKDLNRRRGSAVRTDQGWMDEGLLRPVSVSAFAGVGLRAEALDPSVTEPMLQLDDDPDRSRADLAWVLARPGTVAQGRLSLDDASGEPVADRSVGWVVQRSGQSLLVRFPDNRERWFDLAEVRVAQRLDKPADIAATQQWIDIDLEQQTLVAYRGSVREFATLISSGRGRFVTPIGRHVIRTKTGRARLRSDRPWMRWDIPDVPWLLWYRESFALHAAYWHDDFGRPASHGCVNLAPRDARTLFAWVEEPLPDGWLETNIWSHQVIVQLRRGRSLPPWRKWDGSPWRRGGA